MNEMFGILNKKDKYSHGKKNRSPYNISTTQMVFLESIDGTQEGTFRAKLLSWVNLKMVNSV